jgi:hypothetical protein
MKRIVLPGLLAGVIMLVIGLIISNLFMLIPIVNADYYSGVMRSWSDPIMTLFFLYPFVLGVVLAFAWDKVKNIIRGKGSFIKGLKFGLGYLIIATIPGMLISYSSFNLSLLTIVSWTISGFVNAAVAGMIFAKINK